MKQVWKHFDRKDRQLNLDECGLDIFEEDQFHQYIAFQNFLIHYIESRSGTFINNGTRYNLNAGQGFIIREGANVNYYSNPEDPWTTYWVGLSGSELESLLANTYLASEDVLDFTEDMGTIKVIKEICSFAMTPDSKSFSDFWYQGKVHELIYYINEDFNKTYLQVDSAYRYPAEVAHDYLVKNYMNNVSIQELANFIGISRSHLFRLFQEKYEVSPKKFLQHYRMSVAGNLLQGSDLSVSEVADRVGYEDPFQFSKLFSKFHAMSPTEFRQQYREGNLVEE